MYKIVCPKCNQQNWYNNGDETDLTKTDVDAVKCINCEKMFPVEGFGFVYDEPFDYCLEHLELNIAHGFEMISTK